MSTATELLDDILKGFEFVPADGVPYITLDSQRRFYLNATARKLLGVKPYQRLAIAYNPLTQSLAVVKPSSNLDIHAEISQYNVDKRYYMSARKFVSMYAYADEEAPYEFVYERGSSDGTAFIFRLKRNGGEPCA